MAIGDQTDMLSRLRAALPAGWFPTDAPILDAALSAPAEMWSWVHGLIEYARLQTRIKTATGSWLDMAAADFFRDGMPRFTNEGDTAYRARILAGLLPERATRAAVIAVVTALTGRAPLVFEPAHTGDTGGYGDGTATWRGMAYGASGGWGSLTHPFQAFVTAFRPREGGVSAVGGWATTTGTTDGWLSNGDSALALNVSDVARIAPGQQAHRLTLPITPSLVLDAVTESWTTAAVTGLVAGFFVATCAAGVVYEASCWVWIPAGQEISGITIQAETGADELVGTAGALTAAAGCWQRISGRFRATGGATHLVVRIDYGLGAETTIYATSARLDVYAGPYGGPGGYGTGGLMWASRDMVDGQVTDEAIYKAIAMAAPAGSIMWTKIEA